MHELKTNRIPDSKAFHVPEHWQEKSWRIDGSKSHTVLQPVTVEGTSTFFAEKMRIAMHNQQYCRPQYNGTFAVPENTRVHCNTMSIGGVSVCEHNVALQPALGLQVDYTVSASSFPLFRNSIRAVLDAIRPQLAECGDSVFQTVQRPVGFVTTEKDSPYMIVEPDEGNHELILDHQYSHPTNALGTQRTTLRITPEVFAYIAQARTVCYRPMRTKLLQCLHAIGLDARIVGMNIGFDNHVIVTKDAIVNGSSLFEYNGNNYEPIMHELIDKLAPFGLLPDRFVGRITTYKTSHAMDLDIAKRLTSQLT